MSDAQDLSNVVVVTTTNLNCKRAKRKIQRIQRERPRDHRHFDIIAFAGVPTRQRTRLTDRISRHSSGTTMSLAMPDDGEPKVGSRRTSPSPPRLYRRRSHGSVVKCACDAVVFECVTSMTIRMTSIAMTTTTRMTRDKFVSRFDSTSSSQMLWRSTSAADVQRQTDFMSFTCSFDQSFGTLLVQ